MAKSMAKVGRVNPAADSKPRRQYGTGSVHYRKTEDRWYGFIEAGWTGRGTRRRISVSAKTEPECKRRLRDKQRQVDREGLPGVNDRATVKTWAEEWLDMVAATLRPKTHASYVSAVRRWVIPTIGNKRLDALTPGDMRAIANAHRAAGRSTSTALKTHAVLTKMLRAALVEGHRVPARVLAVERPRVAVHDRTGLSVDEALAVLEVASRLPHGSRWVAALLQGMRQGECLGLTWACVDLAGGLVDVSWQLQHLPYADRATGRFRLPDGYEARRLTGGAHLVRPKTAHGQRVIPLVPWMTAALTKWRKVAPVSPYGLVWPATDGGPADGKQDLDEWKALQATAGVGHPAGRYYVTHEARHTTATLLLEAGADPEVVKAVLGHSSIVTSRGYQHVSQRLARETMDRVAERLQLTG